MLFCKQLSAQNNLKVVFIRHGEKPKDGDNLNCKGLNRSLLLPKVLHDKYGVPDFTYVPVLEMKKGTKHARMMETIVPFAVKYNLKLNSKYANKDTVEIAKDIKEKKGIVLVVWEHHALSGIVHALGITDPALKWDDEDFDSIWIVDFKNGVPTLSYDKEGLSPSDDCNF
jgi:hypothetical protein